METINKKMLIAAIILGLITSLMVYAYIKKAVGTSSNAEYMRVYTAARNIVPGERIYERDIKELRVLKQAVNKNAELNKAEIINKMVKERIVEGEQILKDRIVNEDNSIMSFCIAQGKRAVSIDVKEDTQVANFIQPGDYVDVIATFEENENIVDGQSVLYPRTTRIILQNIQILGIGQDIYPPEKNQTELPNSVTLAVTAMEAERLIFADEYGRVKLALRPAGDNSIIHTPGVLRGDLTPIE